ncbi:hypothetical protein Tco_0335817 [Tanacetum coccineum]
MESLRSRLVERAQHKRRKQWYRIKRAGTSSRFRNDAHVDDADIRPINDEEPMAEVQTTAEINIFATGQQHTEQPEFINEGEVDQNAEQCHDIRPLPAKLTDDKTTELSNQSLESENVCPQNDCLVPQGQKASDYDNSDPVPPRQNVVPSAEKTDSSQQGLEFLFSPLLEEYYNPTHGQAEENNNDQAPNASIQEDEFINPFCTRIQEIGEGSPQPTLIIPPMSFISTTKSWISDDQRSSIRTRS